MYDNVFFLVIDINIECCTVRDEVTINRVINDDCMTDLKGNIDFRFIFI